MDETSSQALYEGVVLEGKYIIQNTIGVGGFGIIYFAEDINLKLKVAIKEYFPSGIVTRVSKEGIDIHVLGGKYGQQYNKGLRQFEQEANRLFMFRNCTGVIDILNFFYANNTAYMVLEYIYGNNLREYLGKNGDKLQWNEAYKLIRPVIESLVVVHKAGIVHCDISPDNIMITKEGNVKIIDFGSAYSIKEHNEERLILLKRGYSPPELYQEKGNIGSWTDVYSVCATLYRMITGERVPELLMGDREIDAGLILKYHDESIPSQLENIIKKGLDRSVEQRIQSMSELIEYLALEKKVLKKRKVYYKVLITGGCIIGILLTVVLLFSANNAPVDNTYANMDIGPQESSSEAIDVYEINVEYEESNIDSYEIPMAQEEEIQFTDESHLLYEEEEDGVVIIGSDNEITELVIPEQINGRTVVRISGIGVNVTSVIIPNTVVEIEAYAFRNCAYLKSIYIPDSVEKIGTGVFDNCFSLSNINVADNNLYFVVQRGTLCSIDGEVIYVIQE